ncbi:MAG: hypothetical protein KDE15_05095 [Erythrobacter sp.]|nr:hypothetical protein [Erythrobacter sp.]
MGDFFFGITEWLRETWLLDAAFWMQETAISKVLVENFWGVPFAQVAHIISIAVAFGATLMLTLRVNGKVATNLTIQQVEARYVRWIWWTLVAIVISGLLMLFAEPVRNMINSIFWAKMLALLAMVIVSLMFQRSVLAQANAAGPGWTASGGTKAISWIVIILWCLTMAGGRWIAYSPV